MVSKRDRPIKSGYLGTAQTQLDSLKRNKGKLENPFTALGGISHPSSWLDYCIPNLMWACIITQTLPRDDYLKLFRAIVVATRDNVTKHTELFVTHNFLAVTTPEEFDVMMAPVFGEERLNDVMGALLTVEWFPDSEHWARHYKPIAKNDAYRLMKKVVGIVYPHQSEPATDLRWFKLLFFYQCRNQIRYPQEMAEMVDEILNFPSQGDLRKVRPTIRAQELMVRMTEFQEGDTPERWPKGRPTMAKFDSEAFWNELFLNSKCLILGDTPQGVPADDAIVEELAHLIAELNSHFMHTITTTYADPRHEGAFGMVMYGLQCALSAANAPSNTQADGRTILRTIVELFITLHYLTTEDNHTLWQQYRRYGTGQVKLAFLKNLREDDVPDFIDMEELEFFANEDRWLEFEDIDLGNWANSNLRKMAEVSNVKDVYDKYYDWSSGYVHGLWTCVRATVFTNCLNPLHRFHRVPAQPLQRLPSIMPDVCKLLNRMFDDINTLYPTFKPRLGAYKVAKGEQATLDAKVIEADFSPNS